ncbi:P-loop NTPase fold protein [uncultured Alistipes sp.]|uniref:P-loop NTPase fold protein n=3 Tax=Bacteroidales TaxID=171549 RepID=UPI0026356160|nr:P-loop NTPase fold protein [uncultured Alistipes sp.]
MKDSKECFELFKEYKTEFERIVNNPLTETDTRSKIIDKVFLEVLDWSEDSIDREGYVDVGYYDYCFNIPGFGFVVEAKKTMVEFIVPVKHKSALLGLFEQANKDVVKQVRSYLFEKGWQYATVTNGYQFIIGKFINTDGTDWKKNKCIVFNGFDDIESRFVEFYNLLSKYSNVNGDGIRAIVNDFKIEKGRTVISTIPTKGLEIDRNSLSAELIPIINRVFGELSDVDEETNKELIRECFIENSEIKKNKSEIERLFDDLPPKVESVIKARNTDSIVEQITHKIEKDEIKLKANSPDPIIIIGSKGAGKTTFINYLFQDDKFSSLKKDHPHVYIDFRNYHSQNQDTLNDQIYSDILDQIYEKYPELKLHGDVALRSIYSVEIKRNDESIWKFDKEHNESAYQSRLNAFLEEKLKNNEVHVSKLSEYLISRRRIRLCIIIDNADQFSDSIQEKIFLLSQSICRRSKALVIISLREGYYYQWKNYPPFNAFQSNAYHITAPPYQEVIQKRIDFTLQQLSDVDGRSSGIITQNIKLSIDNESVLLFLQSLRKSLLKPNSQLLKFIQETTYPNIREGLEVFKQFLISGHTEISNYIVRQRVDPDSVHHIPYWEFVKAVALGNKKYYDHEISLIHNLFYPAQGNNNHFIKIKLLMYLDHIAINKGVAGKYINTGELINYFSDIGYQYKAIENEIIELSKYRLVETDDVISDRIAPTYSINKNQSICISLKGHHYISSLLYDFSYIELTLQDTPIYDSISFEKIKKNFPMADNYGKRDLSQRVLVAQNFIDYLKKEEVSEKSIPLLPSTANISVKIESEIQPDIQRIGRKLNS